MKIVKKIAAFVVCATALTACVSEVDENPVKPVECEEVGFGLCGRATRTTIDPDGTTTRWMPGDKVAVWAQDAAGNFTLENALFQFRYYSEEFDHGYFTANVAALETGDYTYMLAYPAPKSVSGTQATYTVPATQSGAYDGKYDIMIAEPAVAEALNATRRVELNTVMRHQMHAVKITVPEGRNLYGDRFYRLEITFPNNVVGDVTLDITNPDAEPVYSNMSNVVVLESAEGFDAGSVLWAFVLPGTVDGDVSYRVKGERRHSNVATYSLSKELVKGRVTPINMAIPTIYPYYTAVTLTIAANNLGEDFNYFDVYDDNGNHMGQFTPNATNKYVIDYEGEFDADQYDNASWRLVYDSEHAIVEETVQFGDMTDYSEHFYSTEVPYLFYEDFSTVTDYSRDVVTSAQGTAVTAYDLTAYGLRSGWSGARTGGYAGKSLRFGSRVDRVWGYTHTYGRLDSPALSCLKEGAMVDVSVSFNYSAGRDGDSGYTPRVAYGSTTTTGLIDGTSGSFSSDADSWNGIDYVGVLGITTIDGSADNIPYLCNYTITSCNNARRLSWQIRATGEGTLVSNGNQYMFIDNIKVQIAQ